MKYKNGYLEKIQYWQLQLSVGVNNLNFELVNRAATKLAYFSQKHLDLLEEGELIPGQTGTMTDPMEMDEGLLGEL